VQSTSWRRNINSPLTFCSRLIAHVAAFPNENQLKLSLVVPHAYAFVPDVYTISREKINFSPHESAAPYALPPKMVAFDRSSSFSRDNTQGITQG